MTADSLVPMLKLIHVSCAFLSIAGFSLRGYWMWQNKPQLQLRATKTLPHIIDTLLLGSAIGMLVVWQLSPVALSWLVAKILALIAYIVLGMIALRFGRSKKEKVTAWLLAMLSAAYIVSVAYSKNAWGFFALVSPP